MQDMTAGKSNTPDPSGKLSCVDLFAGAGGFSLAARQAGLELKLAVENNIHAASTYRKNLCNVETPPILHEGDISKMSPRAVYQKAFSNSEVCDVLLGGPPCQGFSTHRIKDSGVSDQRNDLIHVYFNFVRVFRPTIFLMENVPGMLWPRHAAALQRFYSEGSSSGYTVCAPITVDARDYGVPQRRKRVFILGLRQGVTLGELSWPPKPTHGSPPACEKNPALKPWVDCNDAFKAAPVDDENDVHMNHGAELLETFKRTPPNGGSRHDSGRILSCHKGHDGHNDVYGRIDPREPGPTMTTACINPSKGRFVHPTLDHGITVRQAARIQTFPDNYVFSGGLMAAGQQVGNAVPVALGKFLIEHLKPVVESARVVDLPTAKTKVVSKKHEMA